MIKLNRSVRPIICNLNCRNLCSSTTEPAVEDEKEKELARLAKNASIDEPPTSCCQSGCSNCVFIVWAEAISKKMLNAGPELTERILNSVEDPSMKAFLEMELSIRGLKKS